MNTNNIYGIQKTPETKVRDGYDLAGSAASGAAQGAKLGSQFGPYGAGAGAFIGGAISLYGAQEAQKKEKLARDTARGENRFVDSLEGRVATNTNYVPAQARKGMASGKYSMVEVEGDGSGSPKGIGEFHMDKNYNLKAVTSGSPTHEEGGKKIMMAKGDIILSPREQNDNRPLTESHRAKFDKIKNAINRYKLYGDKNSKAYLDKEVAKVPEDAEIARQGSIEPVGNEDPLFDGWPYNRGKPPMAGLDGKGFEQVIQGKTNPEKNFMDLPDIKRKGDPYTYKVDPETGETYAKPKDGEWIKGTEAEKTKKGFSNDDLFEVLTGKRFERPVAEDPYATSPAIGMEKGRGDNPIFMTPGNEPTSMVGNESPNNSLKTSSEDDKGDLFNDPMKYSNLIYNTIQGTKPEDKVNRRYLSQEDFKYADTSATQRRAIQTEANALRTRGRGYSQTSSQGLGRDAQISAGVLSGMENINEREYAKRQGIDNQNVGQRNQVRQANLTLANTYDEQDAQNKAARYSFQGEAARDATKLGQVNEQAKYMRARNDKQYKMDAIREKLINDAFSKYKFDENRDIKYKG